MLRLFVAIGLPDALRRQLTEVRGPVPGARWVPPENMHLTLRFIGEVTEEAGNDLHDALERVHAPAFDLRLRGLGQFASKGRTRAVWADVERNPALEELQGRIESACRRLGFPPEGRRFHPHVTLARCSGTRADAAEHFIATFGGFAAPPFTVREFALYSSTLGGTGSVYVEEATYPLEGAGADEDDLAGWQDEDGISDPEGEDWQ